MSDVLTTIDDLTWQNYRTVFRGRTKDIASAEISSIYKKSTTRGSVRLDYMDLPRYLSQKAAGSFQRPLSTSAAVPYAGLLSRCRLELDMIRRVSWTCGYTYRHLVYRSGRPSIEHLWPDQVEVKEDPNDPRNWDAVLSVGVILDEVTKLVYTRQENGTWLMQRFNRSTNKEVTTYEPDTRLVCPVMPVRTVMQTTLHDGADPFVLDMTKGLARKLTATEFRTIYRTSQMWRKRGTDGYAGAGISGVASPELESAPDAVVEVEAGGDVGVVQSQADAVSDLDYTLGWLRLGCVILNLPPEVFPFVSRSETGAARQLDFQPLQEVRELDRAICDELLSDIASDWGVQLRKWGYDPAAVSAKTVAPQSPPPSDWLQWAQAVDYMAARGLTSYPYELSKIRGYPLAAAEDLVKRNIASYKAYRGMAGLMEPSV